MSYADALKNIVPISLFNKGKAGQIFKEVKESGTKIVMKNNEAECILLSPEGYVKMSDAIADLSIELEAIRRLQSYDPSRNVPAEETYRIAGITEKDLEGWEDVEIE
ncbi:MAG: type II toxin-antitoxin system Phd/YefM family antitoxin [Lachnospiraceae bacterium]|jgi:PHD/YefM family antitoxin component YafN of YafNO toxin-antitoxin module